MQDVLFLMCRDTDQETLSYKLHSCLSLEVFAPNSVCSFGHLSSHFRSGLENILKLYMSGNFF